MKVLMIEPGKAPYEAELDGSLESMQEAVGGGIEGYYPYAEPVAIVCNDEGKINGLPLNRAIYNQDGEMIEIMAGTFFIAGLGEESFADLPDYFMEQYKEQFKYPEKFYRLAGEIVAVKQPLPPEEKQQPAPAMEEPGGDDIRLDESTDLAFDLDEFFRQKNPNYAAIFDNPPVQKAALADALLSGRTDLVRNRLAALEGQREPGETLEDIYRRFNIDHPEDFRGHSLSVSDVVVLHEKGTDTAYYVDSIGFKELPDFFGAGTPEAKRDVSMREQLDSARKQAAQAEPKAPDKKARGPERS